LDRAALLSESEVACRRRISGTGRRIRILDKLPSWGEAYLRNPVRILDISAEPVFSLPCGVAGLNGWVISLDPSASGRRLVIFIADDSSAFESAGG
jgi:hypothetical protein